MHSGSRASARDRPVVLAQMARFVAVGVLSVIADVGLVWLLLGAGLDYRIAITTGFWASVALNYALHHLYTFSGSGRHGVAQATRFLAVVVVNYLLTLAITIVLHGRLGVDAIVAKCAALPVVFLCGYLMSRRWVFRR